MDTLNLNRFCLVALFILQLGTLVACSPKVYLVDRQTVLEDEAAGEWPDFEKELIHKAKATGPTPFAKVNNGAKKERLYHVLNGELTQQTQMTSSQK
jgi:hypothetical protein